MSAGIIAELFARSLAFMSVVAIADVAIRRFGGSAAIRHFNWVLGFVGLALLPVLSWLLPELPLAVLPAAPVSDLHIVAAASPNAPSDALLLPFLYLSGAALLCLRLVHAHDLLGRARRNSTPVTDAAVRHIIHDHARRFGIDRGIDVLIARGPLSPMTWGVLRPCVLVPAEAYHWNLERWRIVLLHEFGHIARHDSTIRLGVMVLCAIYWINPLVWLGAARLRSEQEHACDDLVLANGTEAVHYARNLLDTAWSLQPRPGRSLLATGMVCRNELEQRLMAIIGNRSRRQLGKGAAACGWTVAITTAVVAAAAIPVTRTLAGSPFPRPENIRPIAGLSDEPIRPAAQNIRRETPYAIASESSSPALEQAETLQRPSSDQASTAPYQERFAAKLRDYRERLAAYDKAKAEFARLTVEYQRKVSDAGFSGFHWRPLPTPPVPPTQPVAPTPPVAPVIPPTPPGLDR